MQGGDVSGRGVLDADMATVARWVREAVRWWLDELAAMTPRVLRDRTARRVALAEYVPVTGELRARADSPAPPGAAPLAVILPPDFTLTRVIERPTMSPRDVDGMIALEAGRIMPMAPGEAVLAGRILSRDQDDRRMRVEVAAVPLTTAARLCAALSGLRPPCAAVLTAAPAPGPPPIDLLPALRRAGLVAPGRNVAAPLWAAVAFLFALNIGVLIWRDVASVGDLRALVDQQQPALDAARVIRERIARTDRLAAATLAQRRRSEPLALFSRLGAVLPPAVWLQRLSMQPDGLRITGYRPANADVSAAFRRAGFVVSRYSDNSAAEQNRLGQPFEILLREGTRR